MRALIRMIIPGLFTMMAGAAWADGPRPLPEPYPGPPSPIRPIPGPCPPPDTMPPEKPEKAPTPRPDPFAPGDAGQLIRVAPR